MAFKLKSLEIQEVLNKVKEDIQFVETEGYSKKEPVSFKVIILQHIQRIAGLASKEWRGGYWEDKVMGNLVIHIYVEDSRQAYINSIDCLYDLLFSTFDEDMNKQDKIIEGKISKIEDKYDKGREEIMKADEIQKMKQEYLNKKIIIKRTLFRSLCCLLHRTNFFEGEEYGE